MTQLEAKEGSIVFPLSLGDGRYIEAINPTFYTRENQLTLVADSMQRFLRRFSATEYQMEVLRRHLDQCVDGFPELIVTSKPNDTFCFVKVARTNTEYFLPIRNFKGDFTKVRTGGKLRLHGIDDQKSDDTRKKAHAVAMSEETYREQYAEKSLRMAKEYKELLQIQRLLSDLRPKLADWLPSFVQKVLALPYEQQKEYLEVFSFIPTDSEESVLVPIKLSSELKAGSYKSREFVFRSGRLHFKAQMVQRLQVGTSVLELPFELVTTTTTGIECKKVETVAFGFTQEYPNHLSLTALYLTSQGAGGSGTLHPVLTPDSQITVFTSFLQRDASGSYILSSGIRTDKPEVVQKPSLISVAVGDELHMTVLDPTSGRYMRPAEQDALAVERVAQGQQVIYNPYFSLEVDATMQYETTEGVQTDTKPVTVTMLDRFGGLSTEYTETAEQLQRFQLEDQAKQKVVEAQQHLLDFKLRFSGIAEGLYPNATLVRENFDKLVGTFIISGSTLTLVEPDRLVGIAKSDREDSFSGTDHYRRKVIFIPEVSFRESELPVQLEESTTVTMIVRKFLMEKFRGWHFLDFTEYAPAFDTAIDLLRAIDLDVVADWLIEAERRLTAQILEGIPDIVAKSERKRAREAALPDELLLRSKAIEHARNEKSDQWPYKHSVFTPAGPAVEASLYIWVTPESIQNEQKFAEVLQPVLVTGDCNGAPLYLYPKQHQGESHKRRSNEPYCIWYTPMPSNVSVIKLLCKELHFRNYTDLNASAIQRIVQLLRVANLQQAEVESDGLFQPFTFDYAKALTELSKTTPSEAYWLLLDFESMLLQTACNWHRNTTELDFKFVMQKLNAVASQYLLESTTDETTEAAQATEVIEKGSLNVEAKSLKKMLGKLQSQTLEQVMAALSAENTAEAVLATAVSILQKSELHQLADAAYEQLWLELPEILIQIDQYSDSKFVSDTHTRAFFQKKHAEILQKRAEYLLFEEFVRSNAFSNWFGPSEQDELESARRAISGYITETGTNSLAKLDEFLMDHLA